LKGSTTIAENMDQVDYYNFLNQFFRDTSIAAKPFKPSVYRYVGDQLTFSWLIKTGNEYRRCVDAFFAIKSFIKSRTDFYQSEYKVQPVFRGTAHAGEVITGEVGDIRTQIVHVGNTMLEAAWMEKTGNKDLDKLCASGAFIENIGSFRYRWQELTRVPRPQKGPMLIFEISGKEKPLEKGISNYT
jgi:adenylate cyclase